MENKPALFDSIEKLHIFVEKECMTRKEFSDRLVECRKTSGVKVKDICFAMDSMERSVYLLEKATHNFSMAIVILYLKAINVQFKLRDKINYKTITIKEYKDIVNWLVNFRKPEYTQRSLAEKIECSNITIANIESGKNIVSIDIFLRLVDVIGFKIMLVPNNNKVKENKE
jgi:DNA-binding XRE family transcriptional regulator